MRVRNPVAAKWRAGQTSVGTWLNLVSPMVAELLATEGFEWLVVDMQHPPWSFSEAVNAFRAIEACGAVPFARSWSHAPEVIARILDAGALGIVAPRVSTRRQAVLLAEAVRYPPKGQRAQGEGRAILARDYYAVADENVLLIAQIEDVEGVKNIDEIMSVEGIDAGFIGPGDLALSMGLPREEASKVPEFQNALLRIRDGCRRANKPAGIPAATADAANKWLAEGFQFISLASDLRFLRAAASRELKEVKFDRS